ncbi:MAG: CocE/NonD family hydrolase, partial [Pseudomonadota bacterium]
CSSSSTGSDPRSSVVSAPTTAPPATAQTVAMRRMNEFQVAAAGHRVGEHAVLTPDGTRLQTLVYLPKEGNGPFPTLVTRTPYDLPYTPVSGFPEDHENEEIEARLEDIGWTEATDRGYALVIQFARGRGESEGVFSLLNGEIADGDALIAWVEQQPWSNKRIGVFGDSATGVISLQAAAGGRSSVKAAYAQATTTDFFGGVIYPQGRIKWDGLLPFTLNQSTEISDAHADALGIPEAELEDLVEQAEDALGEMFGALEELDPRSSEWWTRAPTDNYPVISRLQPRWSSVLALRNQPSELRALDVTDSLNVPTLHVSLWHDFFQASAFEKFGRLQGRRGDQKLIVLDGTHYDVDDEERWPMRPMFVWFDHWLKGEANDAATWPTVQYVVAGDPEGKLESAQSWPPQTRASTHVAAAPDRALKISTAQSTPTLGGNHLTAPSGMLDQRPLLDREDVVMLESAPFAAAATLTGRARARIEVAAGTALNGPTDVAVKLVDVTPDGEVRLLRETMVKIEGASGIDVVFSDLAYRFDAGHAPGLVVTAGSFPGYLSLDATGTGTVLLGPAWIELPVIR